MSVTPPDPWLLAWQVFCEAIAQAPASTSEDEVTAFAGELKRRCPYWPPPAESMQAIQADWLKKNPGKPLPPALFGNAFGLWVPRG